MGCLRVHAVARIIAPAHAAAASALASALAASRAINVAFFFGVDSCERLAGLPVILTNSYAAVYDYPAVLSPFPIEEGNLGDDLPTRRLMSELAPRYCLDSAHVGRPGSGVVDVDEVFSMGARRNEVNNVLDE